MKKNHLIFLFTDSWHLLDFIERKQLQCQGLIQIFSWGVTFLETDCSLG